MLNIGSFGFNDATVYSEVDPEGTAGLRYDVRETAIGLSVAHAIIDRFTVLGGASMLLAAAMAVTQLLMPGPFCPMTTPGRPVARA